MIITVFSLGKADAILFETEDGCVMIDSGLKGKSTFLLKQLQKKGIAHLNALILTHYDKDHAGGAPALIRSLSIDEVYTTYAVRENETVRSIAEALEEKNIQPEVIHEFKVIRSGNAEFMIDGAKQFYRREKNNNSSLVTMVTYGNMKYLFMADAHEERILEYCAEYDAEADFLKVPCHGRYNAFTPLLVMEASPSYAVITNSDKLPERREIRHTMELLEDYGAEVLQTRNGSVVVNCTLQDFTVVQEK